MLLLFCVKIIFLVIAGLLFTQYFCIKNKPDNNCIIPNQQGGFSPFLPSITEGIARKSAMPSAV